MARDQLEHTDVQEPTMATLGVNLEALASLPADELNKLIESLQGLAALRTDNEPHALPDPPQLTAPHIPSTVAGEDEAILW